jgi:uncharacterized protein
MNDQIFEAVVTTQSPTGTVHVAPMGIRYRADVDGQGAPGVLLMPFKPSTTLDNILATGVAVLNRVVDGRVFAGCVTGRGREGSGLGLSLVPATQIAGQVLGSALSHLELRLQRVDDAAQRPTLWLRTVCEVQHAAFVGLNRAQAAVLEGAVLVSRLHLLPADKIVEEMRYLQIAIDKTAGPEEHEAWGWLRAAVAAAMATAPESAR